MMLPSIAGNDPYLRETLLNVAKLYYNYQQQSQPDSGTAAEEQHSSPPASTAGRSESSASTLSPSPSVRLSASTSAFSVDNICSPK
uniref:BESS domain-containing protein n=1 Tax=Mesocestoides corti TaxID=53468 RepID=A0A5K3EX66_MESCO